MTLEEIRQLSLNDMTAVNQHIFSQLSSEVALINQLGIYIVNSGGKRLRPLLAVLAARALGYEGQQHITLATIVEFIHTATLLHDDVVDESMLRRGKETANAVFGNQASVLVGDFLYTRSFQLMVSLGRMRVMEILADATNIIAEGEVLQYTGIPYFAPDFFRVARIRNPMKIKQLQKGLQQLGEEGAVQVFKPLNSSDLILGAVGALQFEVVASRLMNEYGVDAVFDTASINCARWVTCEDKKMMSDFQNSSAGHQLALDAADNLAYLANSAVNLRVTQERWPQIVFHETREHASKLS